MRPIPPAVRAAIMARSMTGAHLPTHEILIGGERGVIGDDGSGTDHKSDSYRPPKTVQGYQGETHNRISNWVPTSDGRHMCAWTEDIPELGNRIVVGYTENAMTYINDHYPVTETLVTGVSVETLEPAQVSLFRLEERGEALMFIKDRRSPVQGMKLDCYKSSSGDGDDFVLHTNVYTNAHDPDAHPSSTLTEMHGDAVATPVRTQSGRILVAFGGSWFRSWVWGSVSACFVYHSDDDGDSWTRGMRMNRYSWALTMGQPVQLPDGTLFIEYQEKSGANYILRSDTDGSTWTNMTPDREDQFRQNFSDEDRGTGFAGQVWSGSFFYDEKENAAYRVVSATYHGCGIYVLDNPTRDNFLDKGEWRYVMYIHSNFFSPAKMWHTPSGTMAIELYESHRTIIIGMSEPEGIPIPAKSITVTKGRGGAADATVVFDNTDGVYSSDRSGEYQNMMWPNVRMVVKQGYGDDTVETIESMMDRVIMKNFPQELTVRARDRMKRALDQTVTAGDGSRSVRFTDATPESIFTTLAGWAGFHDVFSEASGVTIPDFVVSWETYADVFEELAEMVNFEFFCDEHGRLYFREDTDRQPEATESLTLVGDEWTSLGQAQAVTYRDRVFDAAGEIQYTRSVDYEIEYGFEEPHEARIRRVSGGAISDGQTVLVSYVYPAWTFREGVDIVGVEYQISDDDLYSEVVVFGGTPEGSEEPVTATARPGNEDYFGVLPDKVMVVHAHDSVTHEAVQEIADRTAMKLRVKGRRVMFNAIGVPHLQVGDCIRVLEYTTTMSEIYRITDMTLLQDTNGLLMQIECYHYGPAYA